MPLDLIMLEIKTQTRHFFCKRFFELWTLFPCKNICVVNPPGIASHRFPMHLSRKIPHIARYIFGNRGEVKISNAVPIALTSAVVSNDAYCLMTQDLSEE